MCVVTIAMFFVFCKQKTAYEMRISDWSSDVCSSDLSSQGLRCAARSILHRIEPDGGCACIFKRHPGRACSGTVAPQCQYSPERQGSAAVARREPYISHRSEEHTSELQSLMRISYAVFCLKKKNTQPQTINTN